MDMNKAYDWFKKKLTDSLKKFEIEGLPIAEYAETYSDHTRLRVFQKLDVVVSPSWRLRDFIACSTKDQRKDLFCKKWAEALDSLIGQAEKLREAITGGPRSRCRPKPGECGCPNGCEEPCRCIGADWSNWSACPEPDDFCKHCGAHIPPRDGEGTCSRCQTTLAIISEPPEHADVCRCVECDKARAGGRTAKTADNMPLCPGDYAWDGKRQVKVFSIDAYGVAEVGVGDGRWEIAVGALKWYPKCDKARAGGGA